MGFGGTIEPSSMQRSRVYAGRMREVRDCESGAWHLLRQLPKSRAGAVRGEYECARSTIGIWRVIVLCDQEQLQTLLQSTGLPVHERSAFYEESKRLLPTWHFV